MYFLHVSFSVDVDRGGLGSGFGVCGCGDDYERGTVFFLLQHVLLFLSVVACLKPSVWAFADGVWCGSSFYISSKK